MVVASALCSMAVTLDHAAQKGSQTPQYQVLAAYVVFLGVAGSVFHFVADGEFSVIMTMSVMFQCLAMLLLGLQSLSTGSSAGISARSLAMEVLALCCRLSSTALYNGYLPVDASGDWIFQATDVCTLLLTIALLHRVLVVERGSYQKAEDSLPIVPMTLVCFVLAALLHADMNSRPLFDTLWMAGLFIGVLAALPQLWLVSQTGGRVEALTSHFVAMLAFSRLLSGVFMWHARQDITCVPWISDFNHASAAVLGAHFLHLCLLADFAYYYVRNVITRGLAASVDVSAVDMLV